MEFKESGSRYKNYCEWESVERGVYNYEKYGLLQHILSHKIVETKNETTQTILKYFEKTLVFLMKYVDRLKNFKNYHWKNR
jgi:Zn/Cd-binding protein ZinT